VEIDSYYLIRSFFKKVITACATTIVNGCDILAVSGYCGLVKIAWFIK
jgi:hypothetical protein